MTDVLKPDPQVSTIFGEVSLLDPQPEDMRIEAIHAGLVNQSRFAGQTNRRVSLLEHSLLVWALSYIDGATPAQQLAALTHDFQEAFILDVPTPLKRLLGPAYEQIETRFEFAVREKYGVVERVLKKYDQQALSLECLCYRPPASYATWTGLVDVSHLNYGALTRGVRVLAEDLSGAPSHLSDLVYRVRAGAPRYAFPEFLYVERQRLANVRARA